jgi:hypothetical protein
MFQNFLEISPILRDLIIGRINRNKWFSSLINVGITSQFHKTTAKYYTYVHANMKHSVQKILRDLRRKGDIE